MKEKKLSWILAQSPEVRRSLAAVIFSLVALMNTVLP